MKCLKKAAIHDIGLSFTVPTDFQEIGSLSFLVTNDDRMFRRLLCVIGCAVVLAVIGVFYYAYLKPRSVEYQRMEGRIAQLETLMANPGEAARDYRELRSAVSLVQTQIAEVQSDYLEAVDPATVMQQLTSLAREQRLEVFDYDISAPKALDTHVQTEIELHCRGSYASICRFLDQAEQLTCVTKLSSLEIDSSGNSELYPVELTFVLYSKVESHDREDKRGVL